ncbi:uncharacterized protein TA17610 [Theileria annulata]|uniref:Uncharacterized protein n=1 Tax=Theileria annulata TaxID=5874 RepID=Q4UBK8_THEAN|nr:uncharacterized protein TA17610 [Theileria annulata]CAI75793.1 hypothetical protein TA17610 [Theileria annulata]|eukprot:XP_955269.1 hypothetical protein TA17610 [Theileria annulata]
MTKNLKFNFQVRTIDFCKLYNIFLQGVDGLLITSGFFFISLTFMIISWILYGETITDFYKQHVSPDFSENHVKRE